MTNLPEWMPTLPEAAAWRWGLTGAAALGLAAVFQAGLLFDGPLRHLDWDVHYHYYDWIRTALVEHGTLPLFMVDAWHTPNFWANAQSPVLGPLVWLLAILETDTYIKLVLWLYTAIGLAGGFALARDLGARPVVAWVTTAVWGMSGFFAAHVAVGHHWSVGAYLAPWFLLAVRRAAAGSRAAVVGAALVNALCVWEGQHHPFLWQNGVVLAWAGLESLRRRDARPLAVYGQALLLTVGFAAVRLLPILAEFGNYMPGARIGGLPPAALGFSLLSPDQGRDTAAFGVAFEYGSGWWEYTFYLGAAGLLFTGVGAVAGARRTWPLLVVGGVIALFAFDTRPLGFDAWSWLAHWPGVSSQRGPSRLLGVALFPLVMAAAPGWQRLVDAGERRWPGRGRRWASAALALAGVWIAVDLVGVARHWQAGSVGEPQVSRAHRLPSPKLWRTAGRVGAVSIQPNRLHYRVATERPGMLVFRLDRAAQRGQWSADPLPLVDGPGGALAVALPAGERDVVLRYRPQGLVVGAVVSATSLGAAAVAGLVALRRRRQRQNWK
jgi:hypothetical protein